MSTTNQDVKNKISSVVPPTEERVQRRTAEQVNEKIKQDTKESYLRSSVDAESINKRLAELDLEWDMERVLEFNAAIVGGVMCLFGMLKSSFFTALALGVLAFLLQHAVSGWCPPVPIFRRLGYRTTKEISAERNALRMKRGDFDRQNKRPEDVLNEELQMHHEA